MTGVDLDAVCALDRLAFGVDRRFFLARRLAQGPALCTVLEQEGRIAGYAFGRGTQDFVTVGPWVVRPEVARPEVLLEALAPEGGEARIALGILESNRAAVEAARALGLQERADPPWRMRRVLSDACVLTGAEGEPGGLGVSPLAYAVGSPAKG
jgi:hypothetical protein